MDEMDEDKAHLYSFTAVSSNLRKESTFIHAREQRILSPCQSRLWTPTVEKTLRQISFAHSIFGSSHETVTCRAERLLRLCDEGRDTQPNSSAAPMRKVFGHSGSDAKDTILKLARLHFLAKGEP
ncbi:hypothetical protein ASPZODRAFT_16291 [Penicilliopsis zonata CBS 506.65]|uniref:Uncharacterized protein n=1 Tax=Penicilliopsis zonata CBS 506.65 TaxID=1073090 RepID=A0A1L9SHD6_9EURO|nr:hypothetical protein ASPZODRAFT_16291 [Penicilliopsis zonata CBS 506.65]OJJ46537.1 hypothetical protein ASPZODRAFT_16291 [Penicilliopsis zonata CBS 506.65]